MPVPVAWVLGPLPGLASPWFVSLPLLENSGPFGERSGMLPTCSPPRCAAAAASARAAVGLLSEHAASATRRVAARTRDEMRAMRPPEKKGFRAAPEWR